MAAQEPGSNTISARATLAEAAALALLATLPVFPYVTFLLRTGVPRFGLFGDFALLEQATRHVWTGDALLGPYSRFHWHHPGPLFFYFVAPFEAAFGPASTGLYVGTCFVNAVSAAVVVACARLFGTRAHGAAALAVVLAWFAAFGNVSANPWNPLAVVLPMMAYLLAVAIFARGTSAAVYPAVVFGALVMQMHIAVTTTVLATATIALAAFIVGGRWRRASASDPLLDRRERGRLATATLLLLVLFAPPIVEQLTAREQGNLTRIASFFLSRSEPHKPLMVALQHWTLATSWLPDRLVSGALVEEGYIPLGMRWDAVPARITATARTLTLLHIALTVLAALVAWRKRDTVSLSILVFGALANAIAVSALQAVVGVSYHYLVFWTTAGSSIAWLGVLSVLFSAIAEIRIATAWIRAAVSVTAVALAVVAATTTTSLQRRWFQKYPVAPASRPPERADLRAIYESLRARLGADQVPVIHAEGAWDMAYATILELEKDGAEVRVPEVQRWIYAGVRSPEGLEKQLHVWFSTTPLPLPFAGCLRVVSKSGDISMYTSPSASPCEHR